MFFSESDSKAAFPKIMFFVLQNYGLLLNPELCLVKALQW
jgi:hypothetical protein